MKTKKKFLVSILAILMACIILQPNKANAALQSNGGTPATKTYNEWALQIRQMQELGGTLGRTDTIDSTTLTSNATDLDIHLEKNTEYGAMVILSASAYGNPNKINNGETTTGNSTGIVMKINKERVSAWPKSNEDYITLDKSILGSYKNRYYNLYTLHYSSYYPAAYKAGDALIETYQWHGAETWSGFAFNNCGIVRAYSGSVFGFYAGDGAQGYYNCNYTVPLASRAVIVVGTGI